LITSEEDFDSLWWKIHDSRVVTNVTHGLKHIHPILKCYVVIGVVVGVSCASGAKISFKIFRLYSAPANIIEESS